MIAIDKPVADSYSFGLPPHLEGGVADFVEFLLRNNITGRLADPAYNPQLQVLNTALPIRTITITATGLVQLGSCAIVGYRVVENGSAGNLFIDDGLAASAAKRHVNVPFGSLVDDTYYPIVNTSGRSAALIDTGIFVTVPTGAVVRLDIVDGTEIPSLKGSGVLALSTFITATGQVITGTCHLLSAKCTIAGTVGNWEFYSGTSAVAANLLRIVKAFGAVALNEILNFGEYGNVTSSDSLYVVVPTTGNAVIYSAVR